MLLARRSTAEVAGDRGLVLAATEVALLVTRGTDGVEVAGPARSLLERVGLELLTVLPEVREPGPGAEVTLPGETVVITDAVGLLC